MKGVPHRAADRTGGVARSACAQAALNLPARFACCHILPAGAASDCLGRTASDSAGFDPADRA